MPVALITGGSSGIGRAAAEALCRSGYRVAIVGTTPERVSDSEQALAGISGDGKGQLGIVADVRDEEQVEKAVAQTLESFGRIDLLVASAGIGRALSGRVLPRATSALPMREWQEVMDVNLTGVFLSNRAVLPSMLSRNEGHIINVCSSTTRHGLRGQPYAPAYCASKFAVVGLSESLAQEVGPLGVRVQVLFPSATESDMLADTDLVRRFGNALSVDDVARTICYMATQDADSMVVHPHLIPFGSRV